MVHIGLCDKSYTDNNLESVGMGYDESSPGYVNQFLQQVALIEESFCELTYDAKTEICALKSGRGLCSLDSGAPMYPVSGSDPICLYGVLSKRGGDCRSGVFTRVSAYIHWIHDLIYGIHDNPHEDETEEPLYTIDVYADD